MSLVSSWVTEIGTSDSPIIYVEWHVPNEFKYGEPNPLCFTICNDGGYANGENNLWITGYQTGLAQWTLDTGACFVTGWWDDFYLQDKHIDDGYVELRFYVKMWNDFGTDTYDETRWVPVHGGESDPCEGVECPPTCFGCDLWAMKCVDGDCVRDYIIQENRKACGPGCGEDPCEGVECPPTCFGCDYWAMKCVDGDCVRDYIIERDSKRCGCGEDPCEGVDCPPECHDCDYWAMKCVDGDCVRDYIIERDSKRCGSSCGQGGEITFTYGHYFVVCPEDYEQEARKWVKDVDDNAYPIMIDVLGYHPAVDFYVVEFKEWKYAGQYLGFEVVRGVLGGHIVIDLDVLDTLESYPDNIHGGLAYETIHGFLDPHKPRHEVITRTEDFDIIFEIEVLDSLQLNSYITQLYNRWYPGHRDFSICWDIREQCGWSVFQKFFGNLEDLSHPDVDNDDDWCYYMSLIAQENLTDIFEKHGRSISSYTQGEIERDLLSELSPQEPDEHEPNDCLGTTFISLMILLGIIFIQIRMQE